MNQSVFRSAFRAAFLIICLISSASAQFSGGMGPGQAPATQASKGSLSTGAVGHNVNLFSGTLDASYDFGVVSTLSGLSFPIRLTYNSTSLLSYDAAHNSGIPYGEGWNLSGSSIRVDNYAFDFNPADIPADPQGRKLYTSAQVKRRGELYFANATVSLPNGTSGRLVYKYPKKTDGSTSIYVLESFGSYTEAEFNGSRWLVRTDDGTEYEFALAQYSYRNPSNLSANLDSLTVETMLPKAQPVQWHLTKISNKNHANGQHIRLSYDFFGKQELYGQLRQAKVDDLLKNYTPNLGSVSIVVDSLNEDEYPNYQRGDTVTFDYTAQSWSELTAWRDILLKEVIALDGQGFVISKAVLKHKSFRPEVELNALQRQRGQFLELSDPNVIRVDSLYSRKTVWFRGTDLPISNGDRPAIASAPGFGPDWRRYQHPLAHENKLRATLPVVNAESPFIARYPGLASTTPLINAQQDYLITSDATVPNSGAIPFTHSVLESPRIDLASLPGGEEYELRAVIKVPENNDMNFDVSIATGLEENRFPTLGQPSTFNVTYQGSDYHVEEYQSPWANGNNHYADASVQVFSTHSDLVRWNPKYRNFPGLYMQTRNRFHLPSLPSEFEGFVVQIGPGSDNLDHTVPTVSSNEGYPAIYNNVATTLGGGSNYELSRSRWFASGAPLQPFWETDRFGLQKGTGGLNKGVSGDRFYFNWLPVGLMQGYSWGQLENQFGANQPTAITKEALRPSGSFGNGVFFDHGALAGAHEPETDSELMNVELIRHSKNPYMLDSVVFYINNGYYGEDLVPVNAYKLGFELSQVQVLNNVAADFSDPLLSIDTYKEFPNGDKAYRNIFRLKQIERLGADTSRVVRLSDVPTVHFSYYEDQLNTPLVQEATLLKEIRNELGSRQVFEYNLAALDTFLLNPSSTGTGLSDKSNDMMGPGKVYEQHFLVASVGVEDRGVIRKTEYSFQNRAVREVSAPIDADFQNAFNAGQGRKKVWGFEKAVVRKPSISGQGQNRSEYTFHVDQSSHEKGLLFGRLIKTEEYDETGRLLLANETKYRVKRAFFHGHYFPSGGSLRYQNGNGIFTPMSRVFSYQDEYLAKRLWNDWTSSWFIATASEKSTERDPLNGKTISHTKTFTYYDWEMESNSNQIDSEGDYQNMYRDRLNTNLFNVDSYWRMQGDHWEWGREPSWQLASVTSTSPDMPGAYQKEEYFYLWDIGPFIYEEDFNQPNGVRRYDASFRPYYLSKSYGIRNVPYEVKKTLFDGNTNQNPVSRSTWYEWDVFRKVGSDFVRTTDSTNINASCGNPGSGGVVVGDLNVVTVGAGKGSQVKANVIGSELADDPAYVRDALGVWYHFPIARVGAISTQDYNNLSPASPSPLPGFSSGWALGPEGSVKYFGTLELSDGSTIPASQLIPARRNHGEQAVLSDSLTSRSKEKTTPLIFVPHKHSAHGRLCTKIHAYSSDSLMTEALLSAELGSGGSTAEEQNNTVGIGGTGGNNGSPEPQLYNLINLLDNQFFLRAVYEQADSTPNIFLGDSLHNTAFPSPHNVFDSLYTTELWLGVRWRFIQRLPYAAIRTYRVNQRNAWGLVVDEEDARHLHTLYEYAPGYWKTWYDSCGNINSSLERRHLGMPLSMTVTDFGSIEHISRWSYNPYNTVSTITLPNREHKEYRYDPYKRVTWYRLNGTLREEYKYNQWNNDRNLSWNTITEQNWVTVGAWQFHGQGQLATGYVDPLGRNQQTVLSFLNRQGTYSKRISGAVEYDAWGRVSKAYKSWGTHNGGNAYYEPTPPNRPFAETRYENDSRGRSLKTAKPGNAINGNHTADMSYRIISLSEFRTETGATSQQISELWPGLQVTGNNNGNGGGNLGTNKTGPVSANESIATRGGSVLVRPGSMGAIKLYKTVSEDEDGKMAVQYADAYGREIASLRFTDDAKTDKVLTLFVRETQGNVRKVYHPNELISTTRFNFMGWPIESRSPDAGLKKVMYNQAGDVKLWQDENLREDERCYVLEYDRMGRIVRESTAEVGTLSRQLGNTPYLPLHYRDSLELEFRSVHSIWDELLINPEDGNTVGTLSKDYAQICFPRLDFPLSAVQKVKEFRYDHSIDTLVPHIPTISGQERHPAAMPTVLFDKKGYAGRLALEKIFNPSGNLSEVSYYGYDEEGRPKWLIRQFAENGIKPGNRGDVHAVHYPEYDYQGRLYRMEVDLWGDEQTDFWQENAYTGFGELHTVKIGKKDALIGEKIAEYSYEVNTGLVENVRYFRKGMDRPRAAEQVVDSLAYAYDDQDRLTGMQSLMLSYGLFYDGNGPNNPGATAAATANFDKNHNGLINGWRMDYSVAQYGVRGFRGATVYGFTYDGMNRLTEADASVVEGTWHLSPAQGNLSGQSFNQGGNFGTRINQSRAAWYGDCRYSYDKVGNLTGLRRYNYFSPLTPVSGSLGDNWTYEYRSGTNQLGKLRTNGMANIELSYDINGNLSSDSKKGLQNFVYSPANLPVSFEKASGEEIAYTYGSADQRIFKTVKDATGNEKREYFFRGPGGESIAILDLEEEEWDFHVYGLDLIAEWSVADSALRDSSQSSQQRLAPRWKRALRAVLRNGLALIPGALPALRRPSPETERLPLIAPVVAVLQPALFDLEEAITRKVQSLGEPERSEADSLFGPLKFFIKDHLGNVRVTYLAWVDSVDCEPAYEVQAVMDYFPYGKHLRSWFKDEAERLQSTLNERDPESGLDYRGARYYDSDYGRFLAIDPLAGDFSGWSGYNYVMGNPIGLIDPAGLSPEGDGGGPGKNWPKDKQYTLYQVADHYGWMDEASGAAPVGEVGAYTLWEYWDQSGSVMYYTAGQTRNEVDRIDWVIHPQGLNSFIQREENPSYELARASNSANYILDDGLQESELKAIGGDYWGGMWAMAGEHWNTENIITGLGILAGGLHVRTAGVRSVTKGGTKLKPLGLGSTGRTSAKNLSEQFAMKEIMSNPAALGKVIPKLKPLKDPRWEGWIKMSNKNAHGVEIHFNAQFKNGSIINVDDFKFIE